MHDNNQLDKNERIAYLQLIRGIATRSVFRIANEYNKVEIEELLKTPLPADVDPVNYTLNYLGYEHTIENIEVDLYKYIEQLTKREEKKILKQLLKEVVT